MPTVDLVNALQFLATMLIPILGSIIGLLLKRIRTLDERLDELEDVKAERSYTLFGVEEDPNSTGLAEEVVQLRTDLSDLRHDVRRLADMIEQSNEFEKSGRHDTLGRRSDRDSDDDTGAD